MIGTKHKFISFAAPTPEDIAAFDALSEADQKAVIEEELAKGFTGKVQTWNRELMEEIVASALAEIARKNAQTRN